MISFIASQFGMFLWIEIDTLAYDILIYDIIYIFIKHMYVLSGARKECAIEQFNLFMLET